MKLYEQLLAVGLFLVLGTLCVGSITETVYKYEIELARLKIEQSHHCHRQPSGHRRICPEGMEE